MSPLHSRKTIIIGKQMQMRVVDIQGEGEAR